MKVDQIRLLFTYGIAAVVIVGGGLMLYTMRSDPEAASGNIALALVAFIGSAITFVFGQEAATRATRAAQSSTPPPPNPPTA